MAPSFVAIVSSFALMAMALANDHSCSSTSKKGDVLLQQSTVKQHANGSTNVQHTSADKSIGLTRYADLPTAEYYLIKDVDSGKCLEADNCGNINNKNYKTIILATCSTSVVCQQWTVNGSAWTEDGGGDSTGCAIQIKDDPTIYMTVSYVSNTIGDSVPGVVAHKKVKDDGTPINRRRSLQAYWFKEEVKITPAERRRDNVRRRTYMKLMDSSGDSYIAPSDYWDDALSTGGADNFQILAEGGDAVDKFTWGCYNNP